MDPDVTASSPVNQTRERGNLAAVNARIQHTHKKTYQYSEHGTPKRSSLVTQASGAHVPEAAHQRLDQDQPVQVSLMTRPPHSQECTPIYKNPVSPLPFSSSAQNRDRCLHYLRTTPTVYTFTHTYTHTFTHHSFP